MEKKNEHVTFNVVPKNYAVDLSVLDKMWHKNEFYNNKQSLLLVALLFLLPFSLDLPLVTRGDMHSCSIPAMLQLATLSLQIWKKILELSQYFFLFLVFVFICENSVQKKSADIKRNEKTRDALRGRGYIHPRERYKSLIFIGAIKSSALNLSQGEREIVRESNKG
jgi:hypothetical protein